MRPSAGAPRRPFGLKVELRVGAEWHGLAAELSPEAQVHVYRIVQEAVNNAVKHAQADRLLVELDSDDQAFSVTVRDNGRGMDQQPSASAGRSALPLVVSTGTGLSAMRERGHLLNGHFDVGAAPGGNLRHAPDASPRQATFQPVGPPCGVGAAKPAPDFATSSEIIRDGSATPSK
ncbi:sensor histidine kinase [Streptomyces sp. L7]